MLRWRLILGAVFIAALVVLCWLDVRSDRPGQYLLPLSILLVVLASEEVLSLLAARDLRPLPSVVYGGSLAVLLASYTGVWYPESLGPLGWSAVAISLSLLAAFVGEMARYRQPGKSIIQVALALFGVLYVGGLFAFLLQLRVLGPTAERSDLGAFGIVPLASLLFVVKFSDTGAYTVGRLFGRHKMTPTLSPGKTWEGGLGGIAAACLGAWLSQAVLLPAAVDLSVLPRLAPAWGWLAYGLIVGVAGMLGDLAESLLKRDMGRKDSS
ncbi:MAG: phosphatidate cytidylyltransferase, partial [Planctomycetaceae bacterium]|nr:phosphatidate cytidylyltransferase [Planctomycetaceae bacterium]